MIRSMSSALSGMRAHQGMIDVVGNNIANVSTAGFKTSGVVFQDVLTQVISGAGAPTVRTAGTNPSQIGLGVRIAGITQSMGQGALSRTGRAGDMSIQGDGFFVLEQNGARTFTRAGSFTIDALGRLSSVEGGLVQGWQANATGVITTTGPVGPMVLRVGDQLPPNQTEEVLLGGNISSAAIVGATVQTAVAMYDQQGNEVLLQVTLTKTAANAWTATATYGSPAVAVALTDGALTFDASGELTAPVDHNMNIAGGLIPGFPNPITLDLGAVGAPGRVTQYAGSQSLVVTEQDGFAYGVLQSYSV